MQSFIMSYPVLTKLFMSNMPASFWRRQGQKSALKIFKEASQKSPAYKEFLRKQRIKPKNIISMADFKKLPIINKKNYIEKYPLGELTLEGDLSSKYTVEKSSGYGGGSFFWPRTAKEDAIFPKYIEYSFVQFYGIDKKKTLVILTLALGTWTSGEKMAEALRMAAKNPKYKMTVITPGANLEEVIEIVKSLSSEYEQTVIVGYPPFIKSVIDEGIRHKINWKKFNTKLGLGGEGYSEAWREYMAEKIGLPKKDLLGISGGYGAADVGMSVGREYPMSVMIRKLAYKDKNLAADLFGMHSFLPSLLQFNPSTFFIESNQNGELLFTVNAGIPLVRYNIHDKGGVIYFDEMISILEKHGIDIYKKLASYGYERGDIWKMPFFYVFGRSDGTISVGGANIYPENIEAALYHPDAKVINAHKLTLELDENMNTCPSILVELTKDTHPLSESDSVLLEKRLHDLFLNKMLQINNDFRDAYRVDPKTTDPKVKIFSFSQGPFAEDKRRIKKRYIIRKGAR